MDVLKYPISTEKAIRLIESDNVISFIVDRRSTKHTIKKEMESRFKVKIKDMKIMMTQKGQKKAYIRLQKDFPAIDIATQLGLM